jgi:DNA-binding NarL/FixJ family response regulator
MGERLAAQGGPSQEGAVTVLAVDDSPAYLGALRDVVGAARGFELIGEASSGEEAVHLAARLGPDLVLMDVRLPGLDGIAACAHISQRRPATVILLLSSAEEDALPARAAAAAAATLDKRLVSPRTLAELWSAHRPEAPGWG